METYLKKFVDDEMVEYSDGAYADHGSARDQIERLVIKVEQAILEQAAVECEKRVLEVSSNYHDKCCDYTNGEVKGAGDCIAVIRALKTQGD